VSFAVLSPRFSTNTLPRWPLAQPNCGCWATNGEINTLLGNLKLRPRPPNPTRCRLGWRPPATSSPCERGLSDLPISTAMLELIGAQRGRPITDCLLTLVPELSRAAGKLDFPAQRCGHFTSTPPPSRTLGMAGVGWCSVTRRSVGASLDRNGLRPARYCITRGMDLVVMAFGNRCRCPIEEAGSLKGSLALARCWPSTWKNGSLLKNWQVKEEVAARHPLLAA